MSMTDYRILAGHIRFLRETLNENYVQFALRLGVTVERVCSFEIATRRPGPETSQKLYEAAVQANRPELVQYFEERAHRLREWTEMNERATRRWHQEVQANDATKGDSK